MQLKREMKTATLMKMERKKTRGEYMKNTGKYSDLRKKQKKKPRKMQKHKASLMKIVRGVMKTRGVYLKALYY